jgi:hypothetical protein
MVECAWLIHTSPFDPDDKVESSKFKGGVALRARATRALSKAGKGRVLWEITR